MSNQEETKLTKKHGHLESSPLRWIKKEGQTEPYTIIERKVEDDPENEDLFFKRLKEIIGVKDTELAIDIFSYGSGTIKTLMKDSIHGYNVTTQVLNDVKPKDAVEARLALQAHVAFSYAMTQLSRASSSEYMGNADSCANLAVKFMRLHNETVEALSKYRRGGVQHVVVNHLQNNVMANNATINNNLGGGESPKIQGGTSCQQTANYAEQKLEQMGIGRVNNQQWLMDAVGSTGENPQEQLQRMEKEE